MVVPRFTTRVIAAHNAMMRAAPARARNHDRVVRKIPMSHEHDELTILVPRVADFAHVADTCF